MATGLVLHNKDEVNAFKIRDDASFVPMTTDAFKNTVIRQIEQSLTPDVLKGFNGPATHNAIKFGDILGEHDSLHWWRLYINPRDWQRAQATHREKKIPPGQLYNDEMKLLGREEDFHTSMVDAYSKYLVGNSVDPMTLTRNQYLQIWRDAKPKQQGVALQETKFREKTGKKSGTFHGSRTLAQDVLNEKLQVKGETFPLVEEPKVTNARIGVAHFSDDGLCLPELSPDNGLNEAIDYLLKRFQHDMPTAKTRKDQLRYIAQLVRALHLLHTFDDGCGRTNVFTLLPMMLLRYGFGLSLGGQNGKGITKDAMHLMFNGGFSLDQIAGFLWAMQDFGLKAPGKASVIYNSEADDNPHTITVPASSHKPGSQAPAVQGGSHTPAAQTGPHAPAVPANSHTPAVQAGSHKPTVQPNPHH